MSCGGGGVSKTLSLTGRGAANWLFGSGTDPANTRNQSAETIIKTGNVGTLAPKWTLKVAGDVSATPTTDGTTLYFPDWGGNLNAVDTASGAINWQVPVSRYDGVAGATSRNSPAIAEGGRSLIIGDLPLGSNFKGPGASIMKVDAKTGALLWITRVSVHPGSVITAAPSVIGNTVIAGVSSVEEDLAADPTYVCCTFRGSVVALDLSTGRILWQTYTAPDNGGKAGGYSGNSVWGSTPAIDTARNSVYVATGNNYLVPPAVASCQTATPTSKSCADPTDYFNSVLALDLTTGAVKWAFQPTTSDNFTVGCPTLNCQFGHDYDFGQAPILMHLAAGDMLFAGEKSGIGYGINPDTGQPVWAMSVGPGSDEGGMEWGSAYDGTRIYVAISGVAGFGSAAWSALDPATGKRPPIYVKEDAPWSAVRNAAHSYGFASFTLDPGSGPDADTTITVTYYDVVGSDGALSPFETFTLRRPRRA